MKNKNSQNVGLGILNKSDVSRLRMVYKTNDKFDTMPTNALYNILNDKYTNKGTLSVICYTLKKFFEQNNNQNKSDFWGEKGSEFAQITNKNEKNNELTNNEIKNWKNQEDIMDIMNSIKIETITDYNRKLILCMTTMNPPLRKGFYNELKFLFNSKLNNGRDNYLLLQKTPMKAYYIVNNDKVSRYESFQEDDSKYIEIDNKDLITLLWNSYDRLNRKYVFESEKKMPYTLGSFCKVLLEIPFDLNFNILRSSYVTAFYKKNQYTKERDELARKMRHSPSIAQTAYLKRQ